MICVMPIILQLKRGVVGEIYNIGSTSPIKISQILKKDLLNYQKKIQSRLNWTRSF